MREDDAGRPLRALVLLAPGADTRRRASIERELKTRDRVVDVTDDARTVPERIREGRAEQVWIADPALRGSRLRELLTACEETRVGFRRVVDEATRRGIALRELRPEELLPDDRLRFVPTPLGPPLAERTALVTGAAGSIGSEICSQLLRAGVSRLVLLDRDENGLWALDRALRHAHPEATVLLEMGDVRDRPRLERMFARHRPHDVFHAAAYKHVPLTEAAPCEAVKTNVGGTWNVASAAVEIASRFVYISTDKAVHPSSVMGATKRVGEEIVRMPELQGRTRFCAVRFGNVLGSAGSVVQVFHEQIARGGPVRVTHADARRFFMSVREAVALVLQAAYCELGELCVLDMEQPLRILDLARWMIGMAGRRPGIDVPIEITGLRPGEKLAESLLTEEEELARRVHRRILSVDVRPARAELGRRIELLLQAAGEERDGRVIELLGELVPSYAPSARGWTRLEPR